MMMIMMIMMNCLCGMVERRKAFSFIFVQDNCQRSSPSQISDTMRAGHAPQFSNMKLGYEVGVLYQLELKQIKISFQKNHILDFVHFISLKIHSWMRTSSRSTRSVWSSPCLFQNLGYKETSLPPFYAKSYCIRRRFGYFPDCFDSKGHSIQ